MTKNDHGFETMTSEHIVEMIKGWKENYTSDDEVEQTEQKKPMAWDSRAPQLSQKLGITVCCVP